MTQYLEFTKYQGAGNDFIMIDCYDKRYTQLSLTQAQVARLCDRHFGIGADGLIMMQPQEGYDFNMLYYNSDGNVSTMCGNGARCIVNFALSKVVASGKVSFLAADRPHEAYKQGQLIHLKMADVPDIEVFSNGHYFLDTGSPHYVTFDEDLKEMDFLAVAKAIRYNDRFAKEGTNVNFVEEHNGFLKLRTYERGVEGETLACGTGITAAVLAYALKHDKADAEVAVKALGGDLKVNYKRNGAGFSDIWLIGPAEEVFTGLIAID